jgi:D-amino-acid dehydrogenase
MAKALVLGAGIVGITMAYELWRDGHEVTVVDREDGAAEFTSFGNAGMIAPGHAYAWASAAAPSILMKSLWRNDQALRLKPSLDPAFLKWMWKFWGQCNARACCPQYPAQGAAVQLFATGLSRNPPANRREV